MKRAQDRSLTLSAVAAGARTGVHPTWGRDRAAEQAQALLTKDQPPPAVLKHQPQNTHVPGSFAYQVLGGRIVR